MKGLRVTKIGEEIKFKRVWCQLELKKFFRDNHVTKHFRVTLVFMRNIAQWEKFNVHFSRVF